MHESGGAWFSHKDYHTRNERPPQVFFITNERQLDALIGKLEGPVIGFDMEWMVIRRPNISLIQIADEKHVLLIQICKFPSFPTRLREMIESDAWIKVGVAILGADMSRLRDVYGVKGKGILELSHFARLMDRPVWGMENRLISLAKLAQHYLSKPLRKGDVRCSKWDGPLTSEQRQYAADDAYAGYLLFIHLERDRQARSEEYEGIWPRVQVCPPYSIAASKKMATAASLKQQVRAHSTSSRVSAATREVRQVMAILNRGKEASTESSSDDDGTFLPPMLKPIRQALNVIEGSRMNAQG
jgi:ribonuclease D